MEQLYSFRESINPRINESMPIDNEGSVDYSSLPSSGPYTEDQIPQLRARLLHEFSDMLSGVLEVLPPLCEVNHKITLIDKNRKYNYYLPRCPDRLKTQLSDKLGCYTCAQWWVRTNAHQAAPMLCIPKKNGMLRTIVDYRQ